MKKVIYSMLALLCAAFAFTSCEDVPMPYDPPGEGGEDPIVIQPTGDGTVDNPYNVAAVLEYTNSLAADEESPSNIYFKGKVVSITTNYDESGTFGNAVFYISDDGTNKNQFYVYRTLYFGNKKYTSGTTLQEGDEVGYDGLTVSSITENEGGRCITLGEGYLYFTPDYESFTGTILLSSSGDNPITQDDTMVVLPISEACTVTDNYAALTGQESEIFIQWQEAERNGDPFFDSFFWSYVQDERFEGEPILSSTGWYDLRFTLAYPVVVTGGEVSQMNLEWR